MKKQSNSKTEIQQRLGKVRAYLAGLGLPVSQTQAYEVAARVFGLENKHSLAAALPKLTPADLCLLKTAPHKVTSGPRLKDMPSYPDEVAVQTGDTRVFYRVDWYDRAALAWIHNEEALRAYLYENLKGYPDGIDACAIQLVGEAGRLEYTLRQLVGLRYRKVNGIGYWNLADGSAQLTFICGETWAPDEGSAEATAAGDTSESTKGIKLLQLTSTDGSDYDKFFLVPPHLAVASVKAAFDAEITRLKQRDRDNMEAGNEDAEYKDTDIIAFGKSLGLKYVAPESCNQNWDY